MDWTHVLAFGLGAMWMLIMFLMASAIGSAMRCHRDPWMEERPRQPARTWVDVKAESGSRYYPD